MQKIGWKVVDGVAGAVAVLAAKKLLGTGWQAATGRRPPKRPENPDIAWWEAIGWALASGVGVALVRLTVDRKVAAFWRARTGELPPGIRPESRPG